MSMLGRRVGLRGRSVDGGHGRVMGGSSLAGDYIDRSRTEILIKSRVGLGLAKYLWWLMSIWELEVDLKIDLKHAKTQSQFFRFCKVDVGRFLVISREAEAELRLIAKTWRRCQQESIIANDTSDSQYLVGLSGVQDLGTHPPVAIYLPKPPIDPYGKLKESSAVIDPIASHKCFMFTASGLQSMQVGLAMSQLLSELPLIIKSPYMQYWIDASSVSLPNGTWPLFWTGRAIGWTSYIQVDGTTYEWTGKNAWSLDGNPHAVRFYFDTTGVDDRGCDIAGIAHYILLWRIDPDMTWQSGGIDKDLRPKFEAGKSVCLVTGLVRDPVVQYTTSRGIQIRSSYYWSAYNTIDDIIQDVITKFDDVRSKAIDFDNKILSDGVFGAMDITIPKLSNGTLDTLDVKSFIKDIGSSGFASYSIFNSTLAGSLLEPLLEYQNSSNYKNMYAAPDPGITYPKVMGNSSDTTELALENCGNMLIMTLAHALKSGDGSLLYRYYNLLKDGLTILKRTHFIRQDNASSWSLVYNLYAAKLLGSNLISDQLYTNQSQFYASQVGNAPKFGLPYDTNDPGKVKSHWTMFTAATLSDTSLRDSLIGMEKLLLELQGIAAQGAMFAPLALNIASQAISGPPSTPPGTMKVKASPFSRIWYQITSRVLYSPFQPRHSSFIKNEASPPQGDHSTAGINSATPSGTVVPVRIFERNLSNCDVMCLHYGLSVFRT
ncbi:hypothetical protein BDQ17DRAFT_1335158 [Cyathus striatus]|nr:hypothetical protein BDQ17DRAFT_1335158 [Cyathus striatus]